MFFSISLIGFGTFLQDTVVSSQTHRTSHIGNVLLFFHQVDHLKRRIRLHLGRIGIRHTQNVAGKFNHHTLHTQADTQARHIVFAGIFQGSELSFDTALSESRSNQDTIHVLQLFSRIGFSQFFRMEQMKIQFAVVVDSSLQQ